MCVLPVALGIPALLVWLAVKSIDPDAPTPAEECAAAGGAYIDHERTFFGPDWTCEYPPGIAPSNGR